MSPAQLHASATSRPNVYHVVFDGLQTEIFELSHASEEEGSLEGFVYFPGNQAIYHGTALSLASTFSSRRYGYDRPIEEFVDQGLSHLSLVSKLKRAGFQTMAVVPAIHTVPPKLFDHVVQHSDNSQRSVAMNTEAFVRLWVFSNIPPDTRRRLVKSEWLSEQTRMELRQIATGRALAESAPVTSYMSFMELIESEEAQGDAGRYTFVHLLIPHAPYMFRGDCSYEEGQRMADPLPQSRCAVQMLAKFVDRLHGLNRFEDSLILVHGDHGEPFRLNNGTLVRTRARSLRTPLLIKPVGAKRTAGFQICEAETTLLDVAPTVLEQVGLPSELAFEGASLKNALERCEEDAAFR
jgi:hypothetical protein